MNVSADEHEINISWALHVCCMCDNQQEKLERAFKRVSEEEGGKHPKTAYSFFFLILNVAILKSHQHIKFLNIF